MYVVVYDIVHYVSYLILCLHAGAFFHYNKDSTTYVVARDAVPLFQDDDDNPIINKLGIYILDKLCMFQDMQAYTVTADTDIDNYIRECTPIVRCVLLSVCTTGRTTHAIIWEFAPKR